MSETDEKAKGLRAALAECEYMARQCGECDRRILGAGMKMRKRIQGALDATGRAIREGGESGPVAEDNVRRLLGSRHQCDRVIEEIG